MVSARETKMGELDVNAATWSISMSVSLQAAVHLGTDYTESSRSAKNQTRHFVARDLERCVGSVGTQRKAKWTLDNA